MRTLTRSKALAAVAAGLLIAGGGVAAADNIAIDGDDLTALADSDWAVGNVCAGATANKAVPVFVTRQGTGTNTYKNSSAVSVSGLPAAGTVGLSVETGTKSISLPSNWVSSSNGTKSPTVTFDVAYTAPTAPGPFSKTASFSGAGHNNENAALSRTDAMTVSGTVVSCDSTPPSITPNVSGTHGDNGWYTSDVNLTWSVADNESSISSSSGCGAVAIASDQTATNYTCTAASAGGSDSQTVSIKRDATAPEVSYTSASGTLGDNGWYTSTVTATFTGSDPTSGPASTTKTAVSSGEGAAVSVNSPSFTDNAGNVAPAGAASQSFKIDLNNPVASFLEGPADGATYSWGSAPSAPTCTSMDNLGGSGGAGCAVTGYSTSVGTHTLTATAQDNAGRTGTATMTYTVDPWTVSNFFQPVDMGVTNTAKAGSTVPVKFEITSAGTELSALSAVTSVRHQSINCQTMGAQSDEIEATSSGSTGLKYDPTNGGQYVYTWKTPGAGCYKLTVTAADGSTQTANFQLRK